MRHFTATLVGVLLFITSSKLLATEYDIAFSGLVLSVSPKDPLRAIIAALAPVSGHVLYRSDSTASDPLPECDCMGYRQQIANGFSATFGTTMLRADSYVVEIKNDFLQPNVPMDALTVVFSNDFSPHLEPPLLIGGSPFSNSFFHLEFDVPPNTFPDAQLPMSPNLSGFTSVFNVLDQDFTDNRSGLVFKIDAVSITPVTPGDFDRDHDVDTEDYAKWASTLGSTLLLDADGNRNGVVDGADYTVWRDNLLSESVGNAAAPEPSSCLLLSICLLCSSHFAARLRPRCSHRFGEKA